MRKSLFIGTALALVLGSAAVSSAGHRTMMINPASAPLHSPEPPSAA